MTHRCFYRVEHDSETQAPGRTGMKKRRVLPPSLETGLRLAGHARHRGDWETGMVRAHEPEGLEDTAPLIHFEAHARLLSASGLHEPVADRLRRCFELRGEIVGITGGTDQTDRLTTEIR